MNKTPLVLCITMLGTVFAQVKPDGQRAFDHVKYLAADELKGRKSGTPEYRKAAEYVAARMKEFGLQPGGDSAGYFQEAIFKNWSNFEPPARLEVLSPERRVYYAGRDRDFVPVRGTGSGIVHGQLTFVGYGITSEEEQWNDYENAEVRDKIVLMLPGVHDSLSEETRRQWSLDKKLKTAVEKGAAGTIIMNMSSGSQSPRSGIRIGAETCPQGFVVLSANANFLDDVFYLSHDSWRYLVSRTLWERKSYTADLNISVEIEAHYTQVDSLTAPNVLGILPGVDPMLKNEYILVGGHLDHLGLNEEGFVYNGADDNAGSVAVILELARTLQLNKFKPDRSIIFAAWAGEEIGLVGSKYYVEHPRFPLDKTVAYLNLDMVGCGDGDLYVGGMWEFSDFYEIIRQNLEKDMQQRLHYRLNYRGSDHAAFLPKGVTAISLRTGNILTRSLDDEHPEYHRPGDTPSIIEPELLQRAARYHHDILLTLANTRENLLDPVHHINFVHKDATVVDLHCDTIGRLIEGEDLSKDLDSGHIDIPKLKAGAVDLQVFACYVGPPQDDVEKFQAAKVAFVQIDGIHRLVQENPDDIALITRNDEVQSLRGTGKVGAIIGIEGGYAIENDLALLRSFYRGGVRLMTLTHWTRTDWADASGDDHPLLGGLTGFGEEVVREMNRLGMIIDVSHVHDETFWDVLKITDSPVIASHSCCRALSEHHRNLSDEMLKALAENGGVIGINFAPGFLNAGFEEKANSLRRELARKYGVPEDDGALGKSDPETLKKFRSEFNNRLEEIRKQLPPIDVKSVVDHIDHVVKVTGNADHVAMGSDFDGINSTPTGLEHAGKLANITAELMARGYREDDIKKILGGNFLRVFARVCNRSQ